MTEARESEVQRVLQLLWGHTYDKVADGIYVGGIDSIYELNKIENLGLVISIVRDERKRRERIEEWIPGGVKHIFIDLADSPKVQISNHFASTTAAISEARAQRLGVLIHCMAGHSRSVSITTAYLMKLWHKSAFDVIDEIMRHRPCISPNKGFVRQLIEYQTEQLGIPLEQ
jgi:protein-tyrosine phosphatase